VKAIEARYERRQAAADRRLYDPLDAYVTRVRQERERGLIACLNASGLIPVANKRVLEIGCGTGANLIELIRLGFRPENLVGNDLLEERLVQARIRLPQSVILMRGDASEIDFGLGDFDVVLQSTVFTSILDTDFQRRLASRMWALLKPGGGVLWYDFVYDNPSNPDVRGVPLRRIRHLFPEGVFVVQRVTLAPPIGRPLCRLAPGLYPIVNAIPLLRSHLLCWIGKPGRQTN
jgi:SAM-dependent methyltransferase